MKFALLSFRSKNASAPVSHAILRKAAKELGHHLRVVRNEDLQFFFNGSSPRLFYKDKPLPDFDAVLVRPEGQRNIDLEVSTVKQMQLLGMPVFSKYGPILQAKNKLRTLQVLHHENIPIPKTFIVRSLEYLKETVEHLGKFPVILKSPYGSMGNGVAIVESMRSLRSILDILANNEGQTSMVLVQEYVKEAKGKDVRVFVIGGKVIAAMERKAQKGDFRSNFHQGGSVKEALLSEEEIELSLRATAALGLDISGVDLLRTVSGPKVLEVNANPGLQGITEATGVNVAQELIKFLVRKAKAHKLKITRLKEK